MTRFHTSDGKSLGARFAGDNGGTMHLTLEEEQLLWGLSESTEVFNDNNCAIRTVGELLDEIHVRDRCGAEQLFRRFRKSMSQSLSIKTTRSIALNEDNQIIERDLHER